MKEAVALVMDYYVMSVNGQIPIILEAHLDNFRKHIKEKTVVMGKDTYLSLGEPNNALQNTAKEIVVMSRHEIFPKPIKVCRTLTQLLDDYKDFIVIGGRTFFADIIPILDKLYITEVSAAVKEGENLKYFPSFTQLKLKNPHAEFKHEGDFYYRLLEYTR